MTGNVLFYTRLAVLSTLLAVVPPLFADTPAQPGNLTARALVQKLLEGGYVVYMRHAETSHDEVDQNNADLTDCTTQRNLSEQGRQQARSIGAAIAALRIPIGTVSSSPYCRCIDTAKLAFGRAEINADLAFTMAENEEETRRRGEILKRMLAVSPEPNTNSVIVSHTSNLKSAADLWPKPEGVAMVFKPLEGQGFVYIGKIQPEEWSQILTGFRSRH